MRFASPGSSSPASPHSPCSPPRSRRPAPTADLAITQRPANTKAVTDASVTEGFRTIPSWALISRQDHAINADVQRFMTARAHARTTEVDASHAVMLSRPDPVTRLIEQAAR